MRRIGVFGLVFGIILLATAALAPAQDTLKIGAPQPMTGPDAPFGDKLKKAYGMAVEEINAKGGVNGKKIEVIIDDHQAKNALAATVAEKLITQTKVLVLTGGRASGQAVEIASVAQRLKTPYVVDHPSADIITAKGFEWVFRNNPTGSIYPQAFNKFISEVMVQEMFRVIGEINRAGVTVLLVEQDTEHALARAHRGFVLESGRVVLSGTGRELLANASVREAYLGL